MKEKATYYDKPENVLFFNPLDRFLVKIFGAEMMIVRCKTCKKIPTELYGNYCLDHKK